MKRIFNITGTCIPGKHFMTDVSNKANQVKEMITRGDYFAFNRPNQYGKTTLMYLLEQQLLEDKEYLVSSISLYEQLIYDLRRSSGKQGQWEKIKRHGKEINAAWI